MEEFISNLIASSSNFIGGRTLAPGPVVVSSTQGPILLSSDLGEATGQVSNVASNSQVLETRNMNTARQPTSTSSTSILRTDMSSVIAWLNSSQNTPTVNSQVMSASLESQSYESYTCEDYRKSIPKPYNQLTKQDCASIVAQAIRSIVLHTCNDQFRQQCLTKLEASNSRDVERAIKTRLLTIIEQEEQQGRSDDHNNQEVDHLNPDSTS